VSTFTDRPNTALLVIDVQNGVVADAFNRAEVIVNIDTLVTKARAKGVPVIWVQHSEEEMPIGSEYWQIVSQLSPLETEPHIRKEYGSSFEATNLDQVLAELKVGNLIICGAQTNNCVRHTSHAALERGYDITLVGDAHTTSDVDWDVYQVKADQVVSEQNLAFLDYALPGRAAKVESSSALFN
jgi:nicotinamidase-related amidase